MLLVSIKYSVRDLICDVNTPSDPRSYDMGHNSDLVLAIPYCVSCRIRI